MPPYPFPLADFLLERLPKASRDGNRYIDVQFRGKWDGILVIDAKGECIGVYVYRAVHQKPLPFRPQEIQDVRRASLWNRILCSFPFDVYSTGVMLVILVSPVFLALTAFLGAAGPILAISCCVLGIYLMYLIPAICITRFPVTIAGVCQILVGIGQLLWLA